MNAATATRHAFTLGLANCLGMLICYQMEVSARREFTAMRRNRGFVIIVKDKLRRVEYVFQRLGNPVADDLRPHATGAKQDLPGR